MARRMISTRRFGVPVGPGVVAAVAVAMVPGASAWAAIPPNAEAFITAREITLSPAPTDWTRSVAIRQTGEVAGHPGNRHTVTIGVGTSDGTRLRGNVTIQDEECDATGACEPVAAGVVWLPPDTPAPAVRADGSVHLSIAIPGSAVQNALPGRPTEFADADLDLTITPIGWQPRPPLSRENADVVNHLVTTDTNALRVTRTSEGQAVTASGTAAGIRPDEVILGGWRDTDTALGNGTTYLSPPVGPIGLAPYAPVVRRGAVVDRSWWVPTWTGRMAGGSPLVTSTGYRLPGNFYELTVFGRLNLLPGESLSGTEQPERASASLFLRAQQCESGQTPGSCPQVPLPTVSQEVPARYRVWPGGRVQLSAEVRLSTDEQEPRDLGSLTLRLDILPAGPGDPSRRGTIDRTAGSWSINTRVRYPAATGSVTLGGQRVAEVRSEYAVNTSPGGPL